MGMHFQKSQARTGKLLSDINVTPFVDVMLVLLIVFMVTAPLLTVGVQVDLPDTQAAALNEISEPLVLTIKDTEIYLQETPISQETLLPRLSALAKQNLDTVIYIRGDRNIPYGRIMKIMGVINSGGFTKVALLGSLPQDQTKRPSSKSKQRKN